MVRVYRWCNLNEEERYEVWSEHIEAGGEDMTFFEFYDIMERIG